MGVFHEHLELGPTVEEQVEFGALLNGIAMKIVLEVKTSFDLSKDENGQNLIWSIEESGTVNQTFQNILQMKQTLMMKF